MDSGLYLVSNFSACHFTLGRLLFAFWGRRLQERVRFGGLILACSLFLWYNVHSVRRTICRLGKRLHY